MAPHNTLRRSTLGARLVDPRGLIGGPVNLAINETPDGKLAYAEILIANDSGTDPELVAGMDETAGPWREMLMSMGRPGKPLIIRHFLERNIPGNLMMIMDASPEQADFYFSPEVITLPTLRALNAVSQHLTRRFPPEGDGHGTHRQTLQLPRRTWQDTR
ncbi:hypothetical protein [Planobispora rosea]|uniref:hypothetical protein n=1 Tax=Planobispora rosea TaxID=35762 RepID=UPI00114CB7CF|nr:hypothetical protein [Planobispora rosea]